MPPSYPHQALPYPTASWSHRPASGRVSVESEDGTVTQYRKSTFPTRTASATWDLSKAKFRLFRTYLIRDLNFATEWFNIDVFFTSGALERCVARFVGGEFNFNHEGPDRYRVSATLDIVALGDAFRIDDIRTSMDSTTAFSFDQA